MMCQRFPLVYRLFVVLRAPPPRLIAPAVVSIQHPHPLTEKILNDVTTQDRYLTAEELVQLGLQPGPRFTALEIPLDERFVRALVGRPQLV